MKLFACALSALLMTASARAAEKLDPPTGEAIVSPDAKLELLFTRKAAIAGGLTEGPAIAPDGSIYFTDIPFGVDKGLIMRFDPHTRKTTVFSDDSGKANGLMFDSKGQLISCEGNDSGGRCVSRWDVKSGKRTVITDNFQGKKYNAPNDVCIDRQGNIYFTDPRYLGDEPRELEHQSVYRIDSDGTVVEVTHDCAKPNGIALSPDGRTLYVADHDNGTERIDPTKPEPKLGRMAIDAFPLGPDGLVRGKKRTIVDFGDQAGCDGMTIDEEGHVYLTQRSVKRPGVLVVDPSGAEVAFIPTGAKDQQSKGAVGLPSNVEFGIGDERNVLYITVDVSLYRVPLKVNGLHVQYQK